MTFMDKAHVVKHGAGDAQVVLSPAFEAMLAAIWAPPSRGQASHNTRTDVDQAVKGGHRGKNLTHTATRREFCVVYH